MIPTVSHPRLRAACLATAMALLWLPAGLQAQTPTVARLSACAVSAGAFSSPFQSDDYAQTVRVADGTSAIAFTPTAEPGLNISINGVPVASGSASDPISLGSDVTELSVVVETPDQSLGQAYSIIVVRGQTVDLAWSSLKGETTIVSQGYTASGTLSLTSTLGSMNRNTDILLVDNTGPNAIQGRFSNLAQGATLPVSVTAGEDTVTVSYFVDYYGGTGNDLVLHPLYAHAYGWGANDSGQLGNGRPGGQTASLVPTPTSLTAPSALQGKSVLDLKAGSGFSVARLSDGSVATWGTNDLGQLGNGTSTASTVPVAVSTSGALAGRSVVAVSAGSGHVVALCSDGTVVTWGGNANGQLGNNSFAASSTPIAVNAFGALAGRTVTAVAAGATHSLALCSDGALVAWGLNANGQLGDGTTTGRSVPVLVGNAGPAFAAVAGGLAHTLALRIDGTLAAWGDNSAGQLGDGTTLQRTSPVAVSTAGPLAGRAVRRIASGGFHNLAVCFDGTVVSWGRNSAGQLGDGTTGEAHTPVDITDSGSLAYSAPASLACGEESSFVTTCSGQVIVWGAGADGRLGNDETSNVSIPQMLAGPLVSVHGGSTARHTLGLWSDAGNAHVASFAGSPLSVTTNFTSGNTVGYCEVGYNVLAITVTVTLANPAAAMTVAGQTLASGVTSPSLLLSSLSYDDSRTGYVLPIVVTSEDGATTLSHEMIVRGHGTFALSFSTPATAAGPITGWGRDNLNQATPPVSSSFISVAAGTVHSIGLKADGTIAAWGSNALGQTNVPTTVPGFVAVDAANFYSLGLQRDGTVYGWGSRPTIPAGLTGVRAIAAGGNHCLALRFDGTIVSWGDNTYGQCTIPAGLGSVVAIGAGDFYSAALRSDGTVVTWGNIAIAPGTLTHVRSFDAGPTAIAAVKTNGTVVVLPDSGYPTAPSPLGGVLAVAQGTNHTLALLSTGAVVAWGDNSFHQCDVPALANVACIAAGGGHSLAIGQTAETYSLGTGYLGATNPAATFTLRNVGTAAMDYNVSGNLGDNPGDFIVTGLGSGRVAIGGAVTLTVAFKPTAVGARSAQVYVYEGGDVRTGWRILTLTGTGTPYASAAESWAASQGLSGPNAAPTAEPFGDGVPNLLKYAFNIPLDRARSGVLVPGVTTSGLPASTVVTGGPAPVYRVQYLRRINSGLTYTPVSGTSLTALAPMTATPTVTQIDADWELVTVDQTLSVPMPATYFSRVSVVAP